MKNYIHFALTPFTGLGKFNGFRGNAWLANRIKIFVSYTLQSILSQIDKENLWIWFTWRAEEKYNPLVMDFVNFLQTKIGTLKCIHTFHGIPFLDDKYDDETAARRLKETLEKSLPALEWIVDNKDYVYLTIFPSDDMYLSNAFKDIKEKAAELLKDGNTKRSIGYRQGFIMNYNTKEIAEYLNDTIPPFFTTLFSKEEFLRPEKHFEHTGPYSSHEFIADFTEYTELPGRGFIVGTHNSNISTTYNHRYKGRILTKEETDKLLMDTGTLHSPPIKIKLSPQMAVRKVVNRIPFSNILKKLYYRLPGKFRVI